MVDASDDLDTYGRVLAHALFPAFEAARGRPTVRLVRELEQSQWSSVDELRARQLRDLQRLITHAQQTTIHYRGVLNQCRLVPEDIRTLTSLEALPLLDRETTVATLEARTAKAEPRWVIQKSTSGTTGQPVVVRYNAESRHWRDATRLRGYGWAGYRVGKRVFHYWGIPPTKESWLARRKVSLDHTLKRDRYVDCTPRSDAALHAAVTELRRFRPQVIVAYASGIAALARFVVDRGLRDWPNIPVLSGAERLWPHDRTVIEQAFGPGFETYGCREVMLIGSECDAHAGLHVAMETLIVELIVRDADGNARAARPGEVGEVAITDLHNLACPMIRYLTGDLAIAITPEPCACGRGLERIGPIDGRVADTLRDGQGNPVGGLVFNILFGVLGHVAHKFQVVQRVDGSIVMRVVPVAGRLPPGAMNAIHEFAGKYLAGVPFAVEYVSDIPLTAAGKRRVVVVERD
ncbi:MAG: phenylacetate--CoA ligase family protein [Gemmatimonadaceae bacterium]|nr:phenylacetate--CoA ligase family protein [Gemmatimonadaceae bacterium]